MLAVGAVLTLCSLWAWPAAADAPPPQSIRAYFADLPATDSRTEGCVAKVQPAGALLESHPVGAVVPVDHHRRRQLEAAIWTDRRRDAVYHPGESVQIRFRTNDDAYVCIYNIDTEGRLRVLYPTHPGDDGFVPGGRVLGLPAPDAGFDFVASGPPGIELLEIVASRQPLYSPWSDDVGQYDDVYYEGDDYDDDYHGDESHADAADDHDWAAWSEPEDWYELDSLIEIEEGDEYAAAWSVHGLLIAGDPFIAIHRVNRRLLPSDHAARDYATDYASFHIGRRHSYPRYVCGDCHGRWHGYDPYHDRCGVFSVRVNVGWRYHPRWVRVGDGRWGPRYVYVRHQRVPHRYRTLKRQWPSHQRHDLWRRFRTDLSDSNGPPPPKSTQVWRKTRPRKSTHGYDWKTLESPRSPEPRHRSPERSRPGRVRSKARSAAPGGGKEPPAVSGESRQKSPPTKQKASGGKQKPSGAKQTKKKSSKKSSGSKQSKPSGKSGKSRSGSGKS